LPVENKKNVKRIPVNKKTLQVQLVEVPDYCTQVQLRTVVAMCQLLLRTLRTRRFLPVENKNKKASIR